VFGVGDKTKGGVMSLQEKMNLADDVNEEDSSSEEEGPNDASKEAFGGVAPAKQEDRLSFATASKNPQSLDESIRSSLSS